MNMLAKLKTTETVAPERDSVGGGPSLYDSNVYAAKIAMAYIGESEGGALGLYLTLNLGGKKEMRKTLWMTTNRAKGQKPYYTKDGENFPLQGFSVANSLAMLVTGKELSDLTTETKVVNVYNSVAKAEVATEVQAVSELLGQEIHVAIIKQLVDKSEKNDAGVYVTIPGETKEENDIDKFFCAKDGHEFMITSEIKSKAEAPVFYGQWLAKWKDQVRDKSTKGDAAGKPGAPKGAGTAATAKPTSSLFDN